MKKIKFILSKSEMQALRLSIELACTQGQNSGLTHRAAQQILGKLWLRLLTRSITLKEKGNSIAFSIPELWALTVQVRTVAGLIGTYETVLLDRVCNEAHRLTT